jgi:hypothetical protein
MLHRPPEPSWVDRFNAWSGGPRATDQMSNTELRALWREEWARQRLPRVSQNLNQAQTLARFRRIMACHNTARERDAESWRLHRRDGLSMRAIARQRQVQPSSVLRGIRRHEARLGALPPPPTLKEFLPMRTVGRLFATGRLTQEQALVASRFRRNPAAWRSTVPPRMWSILHALVVEDVEICEYEMANGWSPRSGRTILDVLLTIMLDGLEPKPPPRSVVKAERELEDLREKVLWLTGDATNADLEVMAGLGLTPLEARWLTVLLRSPNRTIHRETLLARLYGNRSAEEIPEIKIVDVIACRVRRKLAQAGRPISIETIWATGYRLHHLSVAVPLQAAQA